MNRTLITITLLLILAGTANALGAYDIDAVTYYQSGTLLIREGGSGQSSGFDFSSNGSKAYEVGFNQDDWWIYEYNLTTPWDITTLTYHQRVPTTFIQTNGIAWKTDGTKLYELSHINSEDIIIEHNVSTPWDISSMTYHQNTTPASGVTGDLEFSPDGTKMYEVGTTINRIYQHNLSVAWDISSRTGISSIPTKDADPWGIEWNDDGTKLYETGYASDLIYEHDVSTPWDISTAVYSKNISTQGAFPGDVEWNDDGTELYVGDLNGSVYQYRIFLYINDVTVSSTLSGNESIFSSTFSGKGNLSNYTFSTNISGSWINDTPVDISAETYEANATKQLTVVPGTIVGYRWYVSDQAGQTNDTGILNFTTTGSLPVINTITLSEDSGIITGSANITDADEQNLTVEYQWYVNSALYDTGAIQIGTSGLYNISNLTESNYTSGDLIVLGLRATDSGGYSPWENSTVLLANDTQPPVIENATQPGSVVQNNGGTFTAQASDNAGIATVYVSWTDPNDITVGNLSMSLLSGNTYTRSFTFTTVGTYTNVVFTAVDGNGFTDTLTGLNFTVTAASGGGGGGGSSTIEVPNEVSGTLEAQPVEVYIGPFNSGGELIITNEESTPKSFTLRLASTNLTDRISFAGTDSVTLIVEGQGSLSGNKKFVSYTVDREELPEGEYTATFELLDEAGRIVDSATVTISSRSSPLSGLISGFGIPVFGTLTAGSLVALIAFATIAGVLIFRTPRAKATSSRRKT
jgi:hypothetical protein